VKGCTPLAAVLGGAPHTRVAAAAALEAAGCVPAMSHLPLGTRGHHAGAIIEAALGGDAMRALRRAKAPPQHAAQLPPAVRRCRLNLPCPR